MKDVHDSNELHALRRKLYARSSAANAIEEHKLTSTEVDVSRNWQLPNQSAQTNTQDLRQGSVVQTADAKTNSASAQNTKKPRRRYRTVIMIASLLIFIFGVGFSSLYLYFGGNQISSDQIDITVEGPFSVGGGEVLNLQVSLVNENTVPIESAVVVNSH